MSKPGFFTHCYYYYLGGKTNTREEVLKFLESNPRFRGADFVRYIVDLGYRAQTAYNWLHRLQVEGLIERIDDGVYIYRGDNR